MTPKHARFVEGKKFMWDGRSYPSREEAERARFAYEKDAFETWAGEEDGTFVVYTRRVVAQTAEPSR